jgi:hypothetical protein
LAKLQEFDIEIKPSNFIKAQGLCKLIGGIEAINIDPSSMNNNLSVRHKIVARFEWYKGIMFLFKIWLFSY